MAQRAENFSAVLSEGGAGERAEVTVHQLRRYFALCGSPATAKVRLVSYVVYVCVPQTHRYPCARTVPPPHRRLVPVGLQRFYEKYATPPHFAGGSYFVFRSAEHTNGGPFDKLFSHQKTENSRDLGVSG